MNFYTSVIQRGNKLLVRGYENGEQVRDSIFYEPYLFVKSEVGKYRALDGTRLGKMRFSSIYDARDFIKGLYGVEGAKFWGMDQFVYPYINDNFKDGFEYDESLICLANIDIEADSSDGFPDPVRADRAVTAITMIRDKIIYAWSTVDFPSAKDNPRVRYVKCKDEHDLILKFLDCWSDKYPDVITGWNVEGFDVPFLVNRIRRLFGESTAKLLSPWKILDEKLIPFRGQEIQSFTPLGITVLDYLPIYRGKKFVMEPRESYTLNYIAHVELGEKKISYEEHSSLWDLFIKDPDKFMRYNVHDAVLVERLEEKLGLLSIIYQLAYGARTNYVDALGSVKQWEVIIYGEMMKQGVVIDGKQSLDTFGGQLVGGYVKEPMTNGFQYWPTSLDLDSLYSHLIMQYNISPETKKGRLPIELSFQEMLDGKLNDHRDLVNQYGNVVAANLQMYDKKNRGFLPTILENMYNDRKAFKKKSLEWKQKHEDIVAELKRRGITETVLKDEGIINRV